VALRADLTVTFGGLKVGFYCSDGLDFCGDIQLATLGYRRDHYRSANAAALLDLRTADSFVPPARRADHKGRYGRVMALAGSPGLEGAALLTMLGARCGGAGLLHLWSPELKRHDLDGLPAEVMLAPFAEHARDAAQRSDVVVAGPGLGRSKMAREELLSLIEAAPQKPWILDADALYHLAVEPFELPENCVLTPHEGEALRLLGEDPLVGSWGGDRLALVEALARRFDRLILLKGAGNLLRVDETTYLVPGSARSLARGGSGDVLAGLIAALVGRGATLEHAVHLGLRLQLAAAQGFDAGQAETVTQNDIAQAITESWQALYGA
jgi:NAD(P)H-hydrate epimerase